MKERSWSTAASVLRISSSLKQCVYSSILSSAMFLSTALVMLRQCWCSRSCQQRTGVEHTPTIHWNLMTTAVPQKMFSRGNCSRQMEMWLRNINRKGNHALCMPPLHSYSMFCGPGRFTSATWNQNDLPNCDLFDSKHIFSDQSYKEGNIEMWIVVRQKVFWNRF